MNGINYIHNKVIIQTQDILRPATDEAAGMRPFMAITDSKNTKKKSPYWTRSGYIESNNTTQ